MNLTTQARVANALLAGGVESSTSLTTGNATIIDQLIAIVSARAESYLDRYTESATRTEYLDVAWGQRIFILRAYPVTAVTGVWYDPYQLWDSTSAVDTDEYRSPIYGGGPILSIDRRLNYSWENVQDRALKVTYTGGMAADDIAFIAAYPDIAGAVDQQIVYEYQRRRDLGSQAIGGDAGTVTPALSAWIPSVLEALSRYRRLQPCGLA